MFKFFYGSFINTRISQCKTPMLFIYISASSVGAVPSLKLWQKFKRTGRNQPQPYSQEIVDVMFSLKLAPAGETFKVYRTLLEIHLVPTEAFPFFVYVSVFFRLVDWGYKN